MAAFKVVMPREVQIAIHDKTTYEECTQTARDLLIILQNPIANKMSILSLLQSRSLSPKLRSQSPSPGPSRPLQTPQQSRPRE